jgi:hypothetical protein
MRVIVYGPHTVNKPTPNKLSQSYAKNICAIEN